MKPVRPKAWITAILISVGFAALAGMSSAQDVKLETQDLPDDMAIITGSVNREKLDKQLVASASLMSHPNSRVVVVGDSHAGRLHPPLAEWGLRNNVSIDHVRIGGGCPPLLDTFVFGADQRGDSEECNKATNDTLLNLGNSQYDTIVLVARWGMYTSELSPLDGRVVGKDNHKYKSISGDINAGFVADMGLSQRAFEVGVERTIKYFTTKGKRVVVVTQPPPISTGFFACLKAQSVPRDIAEKCVLTTHANQMTEIAWSTDALVRLSTELGFDVVNSEKIFCPDGPCKAANKQGIFFIDSNHLSSTGASFLAEDVEKVLAKK